MQTPNLEEGGGGIGGRAWYYSKELWSVPISPPYILFLYQHSFARNFRLQFSVGVANPRFWEGEAIGGRGWYHSKERWYVPISPPYILFLYQHSFARNFRLQFWVGVASPNFGEGQAVGGRGWYRSKERL